MSHPYKYPQEAKTRGRTLIMFVKKPIIQPKGDQIHRSPIVDCPNERKEKNTHTAQCLGFLATINIQSRKNARWNTKIHILRSQNPKKKWESTQKKKETYIFVTTRDRNVAIVPLSRHDSLNTVSNQIPRLQAIAHASGTH